MVARNKVMISTRCARTNRRKRNTWVREWIKNRDRYGVYHQLMQELALDPTSYYNFVQMNANTFEELLGKAAPLLTCQDTEMRKAIPPSESLALTLFPCYRYSAQR